MDREDGLGEPHKDSFELTHTLSSQDDEMGFIAFALLVIYKGFHFMS